MQKPSFDKMGRFHESTCPQSRTHMKGDPCTCKSKKSSPHKDEGVDALEKMREAREGMFKVPPGKDRPIY